METEAAFRVFWDEQSVPSMYGIECLEGERAYRITTDFEEANRLAEKFCHSEVSPVHFYEIVEDFRRS